MEHVIYFVLISILIAAVVCDLRTYQIPNKIIIAGGIAGAAIRFFSEKSVGLALWCFDLICILLIFYILYRFSMMGAGDIKLFAVIAGLVGFKKGIALILLSFIVAAVISVILMIHRHNLYDRMIYFWKYIQSVSRGKQIRYMDLKNIDPMACLHFTLPLLIAAILFGICELWVKKGGAA